MRLTCPNHPAQYLATYPGNYPANYPATDQAAARTPPPPPTILLAPMEGLLDAPLRDVLTRIGGIDRCVSEFIRITDRLLPERVFTRLMPELFLCQLYRILFCFLYGYLGMTAIGTTSCNSVIPRCSS